jgi:hypothetical protein
MSVSMFTAENNTYRKLIGNGLIYRIPRFQRDYSWGEEEWEDLWADLLAALAEGGDAAHYMGYLVLQSQDEKLFDVIDGQQRLTTMTLIVLAALKHLQHLVDTGVQAEHNQQRALQIRQTYIGYLDPVTLLVRSKLTLNRNNDHYFQTYLLPLAPLPVRGFRASEHSLRKAFDWFYQKLGLYLSEKSGDSGVVLAQFVEGISDRLFFTVISVTDELNAYKVFETLNARGVRLSSTDLLKNYLFSVLDKGSQHEHELQALELRWESIVNRLGSESFPDFLRTHWLSRHSSVRKTDLFKTIRAKVRDRAAVFDLLRALDEDLETYHAFIQPEISQLPLEAKQSLQSLHLFRVRQPFPFLLAVKRAFGETALAEMLQFCVIISLRYNIIGSLPANVQEQEYQSAIQKITRGELTTAKQALLSLKAIYPSDKAFKNAFAEKVLRTTDTRNNRIVRYLLCGLERQQSGVDYDFDSDAFNIEHVLPQNVEHGWQAFKEGEIEAMCYRLGNMALLERGPNRQIGNLAYIDKRPVLQQSQFQLTAKLAHDNAEWNPKAIDSRQQALANVAISVWKISQLT